MLAVLQQFNFCYLLTFAIISSEGGAFHFPLMCMRKTLELKKFAKKVYEAFILKSLKKFNKVLVSGPKTFSYQTKNLYFFQLSLNVFDVFRFFLRVFLQS